jgi:Transposase DDE domain
LVELGFNIRYVLVDSLYGESPSAVLRVLEKLNLQFMVSIRSNHGVWMPDTAKVRQTKWRKFTRTFAAHPPETRYVREVIFGQRGRYTYWDLTTDTKTLPPNSTSYVMTNIPSIKSSEVENIYGERTWVEYGFRQCKSELGWSDFRLTKYSDIARWWEIISCAFLLVSFQSLPATISESIEPNIVESELKSYLSKHPNWDEHRGWKSALNNLQLLLLPLLAFNLIKPWLTIFGNPLLEQSFNTLISFVDLCSHAFDSLGLLSIYPFCPD